MGISQLLLLLQMKNYVLHYTLPVQFATSYQDSPLIWTIKPRLGAIACVTGAKREWGGRGKISERKGKGSLPSLPKSSQSPAPFDTCHGQARPTLAGLLGSFSNDDGDRNEDGKKAIGLDWQNKNFARANHAFLHISLLSLHDYKVKVPNFTFCRGREHLRTTFFFFSWTLLHYFRIPLQKKLLTFEDLNEME